MGTKQWQVFVNKVDNVHMSYHGHNVLRLRR